VEARVVVEPTELSVDPGGEVSCAVRIENVGTIVDEFSVDVLGAPAAWASVAPPSVRLFPGATSVAQVVFRPPRDASVAPGPRPFGIRVVGVSGGLDSASVEEGTIVVAAFAELEGELIPRTSHGRLRGRHRLVLGNAGSVTANVHVAASDPDLAVRVRFQTDTVDVAPATERALQIRVRAAHVAFTGPPQRRPFQVVARSSASLPLTLDAVFEQRRLLGRWFAMLLALLIALAVVAVVAHMNTPPLQSAATGASASPGAGAAGATAPAPGSNSGAGAGGGPAATPAAGGTQGGQGSGVQAASAKSSYPADGSAVDVVAGLNGTLKNTATYGAGAAGTSADRAFSFDGGGDSPVTSAYVDFPAGAGQLGGGDFAVTFSINTTESGMVSLLGNRAGCVQGRFWDVRLYSGLVGLELDGNDASGNFDASQYLTVFSAAPVNDGQWHKVTISRSAAVVSVAVDGGTGDLASSGQVINVANQTDMRLGVDGCTGVDGSHAFRGLVDDIEIARG
jgi:hypothetical protein